MISEIPMKRSGRERIGRRAIQINHIGVSVAQEERAIGRRPFCQLELSQTRFRKFPEERRWKRLGRRVGRINPFGVLVDQ